MDAPRIEKLSGISRLGELATKYINLARCTDQAEFFIDRSSQHRTDLSAVFDGRQARKTRKSQDAGELDERGSGSGVAFSVIYLGFALSLQNLHILPRYKTTEPPLSRNLEGFDRLLAKSARSGSC